jgi:hypothetical protein
MVRMPCMVGVPPCMVSMPRRCQGAPLASESPADVVIMTLL